MVQTHEPPHPEARRLRNTATSQYLLKTRPEKSADVYTVAMGNDMILCRGQLVYFSCRPQKPTLVHAMLGEMQQQKAAVLSRIRNWGFGLWESEPSHPKQLHVAPWALLSNC